MTAHEAVDRALDLLRGQDRERLVGDVDHIGRAAEDLILHHRARDRAGDAARRPRGRIGGGRLERGVHAGLGAIELVGGDAVGLHLANGADGGVEGDAPVLRLDRRVDRPHHGAGQLAGALRRDPGEDLIGAVLHRLQPELENLQRKQLGEVVDLARHGVGLPGHDPAKEQGRRRARLDE